MRIDPRLVLGKINDYSVLYFKDLSLPSDAPPHFHIVIPCSETTCFVICIVTSQVNKRKRFYKRSNAKAEQSLVAVNNDIFAFLTKESAIDCNRADLLTMESLARRIDPTTLVVKAWSIPSFLRDEIQSGIIKSPIVSEALKKLFKKKK